MGNTVQVIAFDSEVIKVSKVTYGCIIKASRQVHKQFSNCALVRLKGVIYL